MSRGKGGRSIKGISTNKENPAECMVSDCTKRGLYRSPSSTTNDGRKSVRDYCSKHKHFAMTGSSSPSLRAGLDRQTNRLLSDED